MSQTVRTASLPNPVLVGYMAVYSVAALAAASLPPMASGAVSIGLACLYVAGRILYAGQVSEVDAAFILWLAAFQNVVLVLVVGFLSPDHVRLLIGLNFFFGVLWVSVLGLQRMRALLRVSTLWVALVLPAIALVVIGSAVLFGVNGLAAVASARNIVSPLLFFVLGWLIGSGGSPARARRRFMRVVVSLGIVVLAVGLLERFLVPDLWRLLGVGELWTKKGLTNVSDSGVPLNWWSAERIGGEPVRRVVSTFADPVNLGTFLLLVMISAYALGRNITMMFAAVGILLTVSKGGLLGCLVCAVAYSYYRWSRVGFVATATTSGLVGAAFIVYSLRYASGSLLAHLGGAAYAVVGLPQYPLGRGVGRAGTMAQQFADLGDQQILESGMGVIVGQLGFPGLGVYLLSCALMYKGITLLPQSRDRLVAFAIFWSIWLNIVFNEVALSPNSSAGYFILLGLFVAEARPRLSPHRPTAPDPPLTRGVTASPHARPSSNL